MDLAPSNVVTWTLFTYDPWSAGIDEFHRVVCVWLVSLLVLMGFVAIFSLLGQMLRRRISRREGRPLVVEGAFLHGKWIGQVVFGAAVLHVVLLQAADTFLWKRMGMGLTEAAQRGFWSSTDAKLFGLCLGGAGLVASWLVRRVETSMKRRLARSILPDNAPASDHLSV